MNKKNNRKIYRARWLEKRALKIKNTSPKKKKKFNKYKLTKEEKNLKIEKKTLIPFLLKEDFVVKNKTKNKKTLTVLEKFSLSTNPDNVLVFLKELLYYLTKPNIKDIYIDHTKIKEISLSASVVMDIILMETEKYMKYKRKVDTFKLHGALDKDTDIGILLHANGVLPHLGFKVEKDSNVQTLDLIYGNLEESNVIDPASDMLKYFLQCLKQQEYTLTRKGKSKLGKLLGEVMDNCKIHAGKDVRWYALGFYHNKKDRGKCHLVILSFGNTIYNSLSNRKENLVTDETHDLLKNKSIKHKKYFDAQWNEEALWTLLSLQDGVSRLRDTQDPDAMNRGKGTVDMIESFQQIGESANGDKAAFTIISGNTYIKFDFDKYPLFQSEIEGESRKLITFNQQKSLDEPPDPNNVRILKNRFPGTIISMEFYIDPAYIDSKEQYLIRSDKNE